MLAEVTPEVYFRRTEMSPKIRSVALAGACLLITGSLALRAGDVPVPTNCTPQVNQKLADLIAGAQSGVVDNVMVCGVTVSASRTQRGGPHGDHQLFPLRVTTPDGNVRLVEVVSNDELDGRVTAGPNTPVFAYGQAFFPNGGRFVAGIHDVHCATHRGADNGWVVVNGEKHPASCSR
jgi:hypothetical protein